MNYGIKKISLNTDLSNVRKKGSKIEAAVNSVGGTKMNYQYGIMRNEGMLEHHKCKKNYRHFNLDFD